MGRYYKGKRSMGEIKLKSGDFYGIGELITRHYAHDRGGSHAGRYRVPLLIHAEGEPEIVSGMDSLLHSRSNTKIIWAHNCGRSSVENAEELFNV